MQTESKKNLSKKLASALAKVFCCPICKNHFTHIENSFFCENKHCFDISKKGVVILQKKTELHNSKIYNKELFICRRYVINQNLYNKVYDSIIKIIKNILPQINGQYTLLDLGSGEATHIKKIINKLDKYSFNTMAIDINKDAIDLATDYLDDKIFPVVGDIYNLPIRDGVVDCIIDFLSPIYIREAIRVLKNGGAIIKIVPTANYLKEIRKLLSLDNYAKEELVMENLLSKSNVKEIEKVSYKVDIDKTVAEHLVKMTPLSGNIIVNNEQLNNLKQITIELKILLITKDKK